MSNIKKNLKVCDNGHRFYKSSNCPVCPVCEKQKQANGFLAMLSAPARRALEQKKITSWHQLATYTEAEILKLHGIGPASLPVLRSALGNEKYAFKQEW